MPSPPSWDPLSGKTGERENTSGFVYGVKKSERFSLLWGLGACLFLVAIAHPIATVFNDNPQVIAGIALYLRIVSIALGLQGIVDYFQLHTQCPQ